MEGGDGWFVHVVLRDRPQYVFSGCLQFGKTFRNYQIAWQSGNYEIIFVSVLVSVVVRTVKLLKRKQDSISFSFSLSVRIGLSVPRKM